jgi:hypothetical protein
MYEKKGYGYGMKIMNRRLRLRMEKDVGES